MELRQLIDESTEPVDDLIFSIIGENSLVWKQTMSYLDEHHSDISYIWKYYNDGKIWMLRILKKKNTICWIYLHDNTFRIAFYFAERFENAIMASGLSGQLKEQYRQAKPFNKSRAIYIDVDNPKDIDQIKVLVDLKMKLK